MTYKQTVIRVRKKQTFLDNIDKFMRWQYIESVIKSHIGKKSNAAGRPAYPAIKMFKVILLQAWHNLSDRAMEIALYDRISFRKFSGFCFDYDTPSAATICRFRNNFVAAKLDVLFFYLVNRYLEAMNLISKEGIIVDSTVIQSSRKPRKTIDLGNGECNISYSKDIDAKWTVKANKPYYGYKLHMSTDIFNGFIRDGKITPANCSDTVQILPLVKRVSIAKKALVLADKGYCSSKNREGINNLGYTPGIMYRTHKDKTLDKLMKKVNHMVASIRGTIERAFGTLKWNYGFIRSKYLGIAKTRGQFFLTALAFNLKKASNLIIN
jgi:IS5 family transposase